MTRDERLSMWVIYDRPLDYPEHFVVREWWGRAARVRLASLVSLTRSKALALASLPV